MATPQVLVVDDNPTVRDVVCAVLRKLGCEVDSVEDGNDALSRVKHDPPDLVILDMRLPGLDGLQVVRRIRKKRHLRDVRVIALTGYSHAKTREDALAAGCDAFFAKPFNVQEFRAKVTEILGLESPPRPPV